MRRMFVCCAAVVGLTFGMMLTTSTPRALAQSYFGGLPIDGVHCDLQEGSVEHIHVNLQLFNRGKRVPIPANIGIPAGGTCLYWLHTHAGDGMLHIEAPIRRPFTLGEFFDIWGQPLSWTHVASIIAPRGRRVSIWVDGKPWHGRDPRAIPLRDMEQIVVQFGPPFAKPSRPDWSRV